MKTLNPLDHFSSAEAFLSGQSMPGGLPNLTTELPQETYLELAAWYCNAGRHADATRILELSVSVPGQHNAETLFWLAWLKQDVDLLEKAKAMSPALVFPFRVEALPVFQWAANLNGSKLPNNDWKSNYYLALLLNHLGKSENAKELFTACGDRPDFAPFYAVRADWFPKDALRDISRAIALEPEQWRYGVRLARSYNDQGQGQRMLFSLKTGVMSHFANQIHQK